MTPDEQDAARQAQVARDAFRDAAWDAIARYRETGELVPVAGDAALRLLTVDEAQRAYPDRDARRLATARRRAENLLAQFRASGLPVPPDLFDRLAADARAAFDDALLYIEQARRSRSPGP